MQTDIIKYVIHFSKNKRNILIVQKPQCVIKPIRMQKNIPMFFIYVYICMQNRRQGTSIKGAFESLGGHKSHCVCVCVGGGGGAGVCGWVGSVG